jgi:hypothetical protein
MLLTPPKHKLRRWKEKHSFHGEQKKSVEKSVDLILSVWKFLFSCNLMTIPVILALFHTLSIDPVQKEFFCFWCFLNFDWGWNEDNNVYTLKTYQPLVIIFFLLQRQFSALMTLFGTWNLENVQTGRVFIVHTAVQGKMSVQTSHAFATQRLSLWLTTDHLDKKCMVFTS